MIPRWFPSLASSIQRAYRDDPAALWRQPETWFGFAILVTLFALGLWSAGAFG